MELMKRVAALLKERQISQAAFARKIEASPQTLSGWMTGRNQPSVASVAKMCEVLGVSPSWLITGQDDAVHAQSLVDDGFVMIPLLDVEASCGNGMFIERSSVVRLIQVNRPWIQRYCGQVNERSLNIIGSTVTACLRHWRTETLSSSTDLQHTSTPIRCLPSPLQATCSLSDSSARAET